MEMGEIVDIQKIRFELPLPIKTFAMSVGIDPGSVHMGIAVIEGYLNNPYAILYQIKMKRNDDPIERMKLAQEIMDQCVFWYHMPMVATIEGSAFSATYRQTELAEIRAAVALWLVSKGFPTKIVNPGTIRKAVLGNGKLLPHEVWKDLAEVPDAAQALACAYYPLI
jgi:Holliday junction resolvasome RuvABC endonuclease subunit